MTTTLVFWDRETEHPQQTIVLMKTTGQQPGSGHCCLRSSITNLKHSQRIVVNRSVFSHVPIKHKLPVSETTNLLSPFHST